MNEQKSRRYVSLKTCVLCVILAIVLAVAGCFGLFLLSSGGMDAAVQGKLFEIGSLISRYSIFGMDTSRLSDGLAKAYVTSLNDPYAQYYSKEEYASLLQSLEGEYTGIGINVIQHPENGTVYVYQVHTDSPAEKAGLLPGDEILTVGDLSAIRDGYEAVTGALLIKVGDTLRLTYRRQGVEYAVDVIARQIKTQSVFYEMVGEHGYIQITGFNGGTPEQFKNAIGHLQLQGATALIFDLRNNGGGTLDAVQEMLDFILPRGDVVSVRYADGKDRTLYVSDDAQIDLPMAVLTNGYTASASELFSAAVRDFSKGVLIGQTTYGKGVMQQTMELSDGSAIKFTVAEFFPPSKNGFNGKGLAPDIEVIPTEQALKYFYLTPIAEDACVQAAVHYFSAA